MATFLNYVSMMILYALSVTLAASCLQLVQLVMCRDPLASGSRDFILLQHQVLSHLVWQSSGGIKPRNRKFEHRAQLPLLAALL